METRHRLDVIGITFNQVESGVYALVLQESGGNRRLPIIIGCSEAQAIECKLQEIVTPRPLTHDTMVSALTTFGLSIIEVEIRKLPNGVFAANILMTDGDRQHVIDARSSDAVALAIRVGAPIYTTDAVLEEASFQLEGRTPGVHPHEKASAFARPVKHKSPLSGMTMEQLAEAMKKASESENYEEAARIKAEIDNRNSYPDIK